MDNKNHFESNVSDFLGALRKSDIQKRLSESIKRPVVFCRLYGYKRHTGL